MGMIEQFQKLDDLIKQLTQQPAQATLRAQLALTQEEIEAYQASSDKQSKTLAKQAETIDALMKEKSALEKAHSETKANFKKQIAALKKNKLPPPVKFPKTGLNYSAGEIKRKTI